MHSFFTHSELKRIYSALKKNFLTVLMILPIALYGQDVQLSMYNFHALFVNPAYTGNFSGDWRVAAGYRNQQVVTAQSYTTAIAGFDGHFYLFNRKIGAGIYALNDVSGIGGLTFNKVYASLAYVFDIGTHSFGLGAQGGFVSGSVNTWGVWDHNTGSYTAPNGEEYFAEKTSYIDVNIGMSWRHKFGKFLPGVGVSLLHVNEPNISLFNADDTQPLQILVDTRFKIDVTEKFSTTPLIFFRTQGGAGMSIAGIDLNYSLPPKSFVKSFFGGVHLHNGVIEKAS